LYRVRRIVWRHYGLRAIRRTYMQATLENNSIVLSFPYPYDPAVIKFIRLLDGRHFDKLTKTWSVPLSSMTEVNLKNLEKLGFSVSEDIYKALTSEKQAVEELKQLEQAKIAEFSSSLPLYDFQKITAAYMVKAGSCLNASEVGSGKTITVLGVCDYLKCRKILVICPKSVMRQWEREIMRWLPSWNIVVVEGNKQTRIEQYWKARRQSAPAVLIVSYDLARIDFNILKDMPRWDAAICDEIHRLGSSGPYTKTRKAIKQYEAVHRFGLSATPLRSSLLSYYGIIDFIAPGSLGPWQGFLEKFTLRNTWGGIWKFINLDEFASRIRRHMIRKTLAEVGYQLPPLIEEDIIFDLSEKELEILNKIKMEILLELDKIDISKIKDVVSLNFGIVKLGKMQELSDHLSLIGDHNISSKLDTLKDHLADTMVNGNKAIVFSRFERMISILYRELAEYNPAVITGKIEDRQAQIDKFNSDESCKLCLITSAGAEGLDLQRANLLYFYDVPIGSYGQLTQTIGRIKRIGQEKPMVVYYLMASKGVDIPLKKAVAKKGQLSERIFDSVADIREMLM